MARGRIRNPRHADGQFAMADADDSFHQPIRRSTRAPGEIVQQFRRKLELRESLRAGENVACLAEQGHEMPGLSDAADDLRRLHGTRLFAGRCGQEDGGLAVRQRHGARQESVDPMRQAHEELPVPPDCREARRSLDLAARNCWQAARGVCCGRDIVLTEQPCTGTVGPDDSFQIRRENRQRIAGREPLAHSVEDQNVDEGVASSRHSLVR
jgi:hypothetical protein